MDEETKAYVFRKLKASDIFLVLNLIKKIGLNNLKGAFNKDIIEKKEEIGEETYATIGIAMLDVVQVIIERLSDCENEIYTLLEATSNLSVIEIKNLDMVTFINMITDFIKQKEFAELFTQAQSLLK